MIIGAWRSFTVTAKLHSTLLPLGSFAVHLTMVIPWAKVEPLGGTQTTTALQLSLALGAIQLTGAVQTPGAVLVVMSAGQAIVGGCVSVIVPCSSSRRVTRFKVSSARSSAPRHRLRSKYETNRRRMAR